jgi:hypothetical protein
MTRLHASPVCNASPSISVFASVMSASAPTFRFPVSGFRSLKPLRRPRISSHDSTPSLRSPVSALRSPQSFRLPFRAVPVVREDLCHSRSGGDGEAGDESLAGLAQKTGRSGGPRGAARRRGVLSARAPAAPRGGERRAGRGKVSPEDEHRLSLESAGGHFWEDVRQGGRFAAALRGGLAGAPTSDARGIRHVHAHFGGVAARTAWWLRKLFGFQYSFTGHANDIFCATNFPVSHGDLVRDAQFIATETDYAREWVENKIPGRSGKGLSRFQRHRAYRFSRAIGETRCGEGGLRRPFGGEERLWRFDRSLPVAARERRGGALRHYWRGTAGGDSSGLRSQRERLGAAVRLLGPMAQAEVRRRMAEAAVFVLACAPEEGGGSDNLPTVIMEAMACGAPVISTRIAGVPEMMRDGGGGLASSAAGSRGAGRSDLETARRPGAWRRGWAPRGGPPPRRNSRSSEHDANAEAFAHSKRRRHAARRGSGCRPAIALRRVCLIPHVENMALQAMAPEFEPSIHP